MASFFTLSFLFLYWLLREMFNDIFKEIGSYSNGNISFPSHWGVGRVGVAVLNGTGSQLYPLRIATIF